MQVAASSGICSPRFLGSAQSARVSRRVSRKCRRECLGGLSAKVLAEYIGIAKTRFRVSISDA